ncbi:MAG: sigma-70 family RNA polymerase sigma factor [Planctomycetota bacterium]
MPSDPDSTIDLISAAQGGDRAAANELFARYTPIATRIASRRLGVNPTLQNELEDIVQDALNDAFRALPRFEMRHESAFRSYLGTIVENKIRDRAKVAHIKHEQPVPLTPSGAERDFTGHGTTPSRPAIDAERQEAIDRWAESLTVTDRRIFQLKVVERRSAREVAEELGWKEGSVRSRLSRVLAEFSRLIE